MYALSYVLREALPVLVELGFYCIFLLWIVRSALERSWGWGTVGALLLSVSAVIGATRLPGISWPPMEFSQLFSSALGDQMFRYGTVGLTTTLCAVGGALLGQRGDPDLDTLRIFVVRNLARIAGVALILTAVIIVPIVLEGSRAIEQINSLDQSQAENNQRIKANELAAKLAEQHAGLTDCCARLSHQTRPAFCNKRIVQFESVLSQYGLSSTAPQRINKPEPAQPEMTCLTPHPLAKHNVLATNIEKLGAMAMSTLEKQLSPNRTSTTNLNDSKVEAPSSPEDERREAIRSSVTRLLTPQGWVSLIANPLNGLILVLELVGGLLLAWGRYSQSKVM